LLTCHVVAGVLLQVRDFNVIDCCPYPIDFTWEKEGKLTSQRLFEVGSAFPAAKMLTMLRAAPFSVTAVNAATGEQLGEYAVSSWCPSLGAVRGCDVCV
jgi:hypothetical protein